METSAARRVLVEAKIENLTDLRDVDRGMLARDQVRTAVVPDALVDTGSTTLALPTRLIHQLGLQKAYEKRARTSAGTQQINVFDAVRHRSVQRRGRIFDAFWLRTGGPSTYRQRRRPKSTRR